MKCKNCGKEINKSWKFCRYCGAENENAGTKGGRKKKGLAIYIIFTLIIACGALAGFLLLKDRDCRQERILPETDSIGFTYYASPADNIVSDGHTGKMFVNNELLITLSSNAEMPQLERYLEGVGGKIVGEIPLLADYQILLEKEYTYGQLEAMVDELNSMQWVTYASVNLVIKADVSGYTPNDEKWKNQWGDMPGGTNWGVEAIDAPGAWEYRDQMQTVNIGVYDNMFALEHPDLVFAEMPFGMAHTAETVGTDIDAWQNNESPWHGTHVAGTIAASFDNGIGIAGIVPKQRLYGVSGIGFGIAGRQSVQAVKIGLFYLIVQKQCKVINYSMGFQDVLVFNASKHNTAAQQQIRVLSDEISVLLKALIESGYRSFVICVSAGNTNDALFFHKDEDDDSTYDYYGYSDYLDFKNNKLADAEYAALLERYRGREITEEDCIKGDVDAYYGNYFTMIETSDVKERIIVVGAIQKVKRENNFELADFSNRGHRVDVVAPGVDIFSTGFQVPTVFDSLYNALRFQRISLYMTSDGTSMAAPHVSGVAALVFGIDPTMDGATVKDIICKTATGSYGEEGYKLVNAKAAVEYALGILGFGYCGGEGDGKNCSWILDKNGVLTIRGAGLMADWSFAEGKNAPWFPWISEIKSIVVENGVEYIGESAFATCGPSSVQLADSVREIGADAFNACFGFEELTLPQNLSVIGESAFSNSKIKHITIPDLVTEIGPSAFTGCFSLEKVDILGALTDLNKSFFMCSGLRELSLPESLSSIGELVLSGCDSLTDIYYAGSESQWNRIAIHADNDETLQHVTVHYGKSDSAAPSVEADEIPGPDNASQYSASFIMDEAHVLTEQQLRELDTRAAEISRQTKCSVTVVTVDDYWDYGSSVETAAENLFDRYRFGTGGDRSAILLLLSMTERDYDLYAHGDLPRVVFSEQGMTELADAFLPALGDDHWDDGIQQYLDKASQMLQHESGNSSSGLENDPETQPSTDPQSGSAHFYELFANVADTWKDAERYCESLGGHLATITSPEENAYVFELACDHGIDAYIGLTDKTNEGVWEWITGEPVNYQNWAPHEPNADNPNEDYAMFYHKYTDGTWNDGDFGGRTVNGGTAFICEWDSVSAYEAYLDKKEIPLPPDLSLESQQLLLEQNRSLWAFQPYDHWAYTFTDLDHNGRLEVLAYSIQGSGLFTYIHLWEISEDGEGLTNCLEGWKWTECAGIAQKQLLCYYDAAFGQYYYVFEGNTRDGSEHLDYTWSALTLKDGHAERIILAKKAVEHYPKDSTRFTDSNGNSISEYDYDHTVDQRFGNMRQSYLTLDWIWV